MGKPKKMKRNLKRKSLKCGNCGETLSRFKLGEVGYGAGYPFHCKICGIVYDEEGKEIF